jgi:3-phosphoshikimate 1-carboxyvinyltransferase
MKRVGYPPIRIIGQKITKSQVSIPANVSSQYISALLLVAPKLQDGIKITLVGEITSVQYIKMTLALLNDLDIKTSFEGNHYRLSKQEVASTVMSNPIGAQPLIF